MAVGPLQVAQPFFTKGDRRDRKKIFAALEAVKSQLLGQIRYASAEMGGRHGNNM